MSGAARRGVPRIWRRASGILLHPTSLPGPYGIGDLGPAAYQFLDSLAAAGQSLWQVLPLGPTGFGDSPYACFSSFAGNPLLVSIDILKEWGFIKAGDLSALPRFSANHVDYGAVIRWKMPLLRQAASRFLQSADGPQRERFRAFRKEESWWLEDYCVFMAVKQVYEGAWNRAWERPIALRDPAALARIAEERADAIAVEAVIQYFFFSQWDALHDAAAGRGIRIIGDLPIFAAPDSADVWANRELFLLDSEGRPTVVSGVPPDYFAATGQLWGNPLYDWNALEKQGFRFWIRRIRAARRLFDFVRIDHFRGFDACWSVQAGALTAERGQWVKVPGRALFEAMRRELGDLPIIAEDLGVITPEVTALREGFGFPGMRILQFAFDSKEAGVLNADNPFLPHNHSPNSVVYTGTHDNDTTCGWYAARTPQE
ncbi:MAG TPA: 4-alpha-glucanotransferase, partial [Spirochaetia bacterium]|nr:4-alpha-glucanotransferase [Spirochaetia bacterium]